MTKNWTTEQLDIFAATRDTKDNLLIEALAGAAKTSTLVELAKHLTDGALAIAFNKKIATEMQERMPSNVECRTLNALGHRMWQQTIGKKLILSDSKCHTLLTEYVERTHDPEEREHLYENFADILTAIRGAKNHGHVPDTCVQRFPKAKISPILSNSELFEMLPEEYSPVAQDTIISVLETSFAMAMEGRIDFADQLLLPTVCRCIFPAYANVLVDEAQDLSELNHRMIAKFAKRRLIAVGDSRQAIYAFRGAHQEGMPLLATRFNMTTLHLSTTFRCPESICEHVRWHVPRINHWVANPNNPGEVQKKGTWEIPEVPDGAVVICRNNAPLFSLAIKFLKAGRRPNVWGRDIAAGLIKILEGLGAGNMKQADALLALQNWHTAKASKLKKESAKAALADKVDCLRVFLYGAESLGGAVALARSVFSEGGKVDLCTGHKSKGSEWEDVFILDEFLLGDDGQELNLKYVMATRAKRSLTYITSEGLLE